MANKETTLINITNIDTPVGKIFYRYLDDNVVEKLKVITSYKTDNNKNYYVLKDEGGSIFEMTPNELFSKYTALSPTHVIAYHTFTSQIGNNSFTNLIITVNKIRRDYEPVSVLVLDVFRYFDSIELSRGKMSGGIKIQTRFYPSDDHYIFAIKTEKFDVHSVPIITALDAKVQYWQYCYLDNPIGDYVPDLYQLITGDEISYKGQWEYLTKMSPVLFKDYFIEHNILEVTGFKNYIYEFLEIFNINKVIDTYDQKKDKLTLKWLENELTKPILVEPEEVDYDVVEFIAYLIRHTSNPTFTLKNPLLQKILESILIIPYNGDDYFNRTTKIEEKRRNRIAVRVYLEKENKVVILSYSDYANYNNTPVMSVEEISKFFKIKK